MFRRLDGHVEARASADVLEHVHNPGYVLKSPHRLRGWRLRSMPSVGLLQRLGHPLLCLRSSLADVLSPLDPPSVVRPPNHRTQQSQDGNHICPTGSAHPRQRTGKFYGPKAASAWSFGQPPLCTGLRTDQQRAADADVRAARKGSSLDRLFRDTATPETDCYGSRARLTPDSADDR